MPGLVEVTVNNTEPDKVNEVAPEKAPVPLNAAPLSGPVTVMSELPGLPPLPAKVMVPVVGADRVTVEVDAVAVIALSAMVKVKTITVRIALRFFGSLVEISKECAGEASPLDRLAKLYYLPDNCQ